MQNKETNGGALFQKGERALYYGQTVKILRASRNAALVQLGRETFNVGYGLLTKI